MKYVGDKLPETPHGLGRRVRLGPYEANFHTQEFWKEGIRWKLSGQPFQILEMLVSRPGELVTRDELLKRLWPDGTFTDFNHSLNAAIKKLREALSDSADDPKFIETLPRRGYRFIGTIEPPPPKQPESPPEVNAVASAKEQPVLPAASITQGVSKAPSRFPPMALMWVGGLVLGALVIFNQLFLPKAQKAEEEQSALKHAAEMPEKTKSQMVSEEQEPPIQTRPTFPTRTALRETSIVEPSTMVRTIIPGDSNNAGPQFSPDGKRLAFMSNRSGLWQIWVSAVDGSNPTQLTDGGGAGTPRWSPDGRSIAFDAPTDEGTSIFVVPADGSSPPRKLVVGLVPSFSRDGKWVYYASDRYSNWQVWKVSLNGEVKRQVTLNGGFSAQESDDGYVYFTKSRFPNPEVCRMRVEANDEECVLPLLKPRTWSSWAVTRHGILFVEDLSQGRSELSLYEPAKRQVTSLYTLETAPFWMGATSDGRKVMVNDAQERQISLVENLR